MAQQNEFSSTGISMLIVGGGIAGLTLAIEAKRKGHSVRLIDRRPDFNDYGDLILIQCNALHSPKKWPGFMERMAAMSFRPLTNMVKYDGTFIGQFPLGTPEDQSLPIFRSEFHKLLYEYSQEMHIPIEFNTTVTEYYETDSVGGVILPTAESWKRLLLLLQTGTKQSAVENPIIAKELEGQIDRIATYMGPKAHIFVGKKDNTICWGLTHADDENAEEDWAKTASSDKALPQVKRWTSFLTEVINATPNHTVTDWKLMWRDPQSQWASPLGRVIQIGDVAHPFLPSSVSGASMAMEDGYSLSTCLELAGKDNVPLALRVHNLLRYERVSSAQKMGFKNREVLHNTDWEAVAKNPEIVGKSVGNWVLRHNPEQYAYDKYASAADHLLKGSPFENSNTVPGFKIKPWTVKELLEASEKGTPVIDDGDWS